MNYKVKRVIKKGMVITRKLNRDSYLVLKNPDASSFLWLTAKSFFRIRDLHTLEEFIIDEDSIYSEFIILQKTEKVGEE